VEDVAVRLHTGLGTRAERAKLVGEAEARVRERVEHRAEWAARLHLTALAEEDRRLARHRTEEVADERGLAKARVARDEHDPARAPSGLAEQRLERAALRLAANELLRGDDPSLERPAGNARRRGRRDGLALVTGPRDAVDAWRVVDPLQHEAGALGHHRHARARDEATHRLRDQELARRGHLREPGGHDHRFADELPLVRLRLPGVDPDTDLHRPVRSLDGVPLGLAEDRHRAAERGGRRSEHDVEAVAFRLQLRALGARDLGADEPAVVADQRHGGRVSVVLYEARVFTEVCEEERPRLHARSVGVLTSRNGR